VAAPGEVERSLEAILMIADEPQTLVSLATAPGVAVAAFGSRSSSSPITTAKEVALASIRRGFELERGGSGWRIYVRGEYDDVVRDFVLTQNPTRGSPRPRSRRSP
jgi:segregation and condensation protein B